MSCKAQAAITNHDGSGDVCGGIRGEEKGQVGNLVLFGKTAERHVGGHTGTGFRGWGETAHSFSVVDGAWGDHIYSDACGSPFQCENFCKNIDTGFSRADVGLKGG